MNVPDLSASTCAAATSATSRLPLVSVAIKALNEEAKIARCIESVLAALKEIPNPSEVVLADSVSTDRTVDIARRYPITIVQFSNKNERCCGAGVQLGYQHARGDFVLLIDGDMELLPGFLPVALAKLAAEPHLAGVAGLVEDTTVVNSFDRYRVANGAWNVPLPAARWLNGGGLYRRAAIDSCGGYVSDRNLRGWEEAELGMRLTTYGWHLERIDLPSTLHTGHSEGSWALLHSLWRSRRAMANGVLIRQAAGKRWMRNAVAMMMHPILVVLMWLGALAALAVSLAAGQWLWLGGYAVAVVAALLVFAVHKRSLAHALTSFGLWHFHATTLLLGLAEPTVPPTQSIASVVLAQKDSG